MRVRLLASLLTTDDVESAARRDDAINECLAGVLRYNNLLYTGAKNIPSAGQLDHKAVRRVGSSMLTNTDSNPLLPTCNAVFGRGSDYKYVLHPPPSLFTHTHGFPNCRGTLCSLTPVQPRPTR